MKKILILVFIVMYISAIVLAGSELAGTTSTNSLKIRPFARAAGLGDAFVSVSEGAAGLYYNPAGLNALSGYDFQVDHVNWFGSINDEFLAAALPSPFLPNAKIGFGVLWFSAGNIPDTSELPTGALETIDYSALVSGSTNPVAYSLRLAYAADIVENLALGAVLKYDGENISRFNGSSLGCNIGGIYSLRPNGHLIRFGLTLTNIGTDLKLSDEAFKMPLSMELGASDEMLIFNNKLLVTMQGMFQSDYDTQYGIGAEYWFYNLACIRLGYKFGAFNQPSFGAGVKYNNFQFDLAYLKYDGLGDTFRFSLSYALRQPPGIGLMCVPQVFSPNSDKIADYTFFKPVLKTKEVFKSAKISLYNPAGTLLIASMPMNADPLKYTSWNGVVNKVVLPDGAYRAMVTAEFADGSATSAPVPVIIDNTPPELSVDAQPRVLKKGPKGALLIPSAFTFYANDRSGIGGWQLVIRDKDNNVFFNVGDKGAPPLSYIWDGKGNSGDYVSTSDIYNFTFISYDTVGNKTQTAPQSQVVLLREVKMLFFSNALFESNAADVKISQYKSLQALKKAVEKYPEFTITVKGYTSNEPSINAKYPTNAALSQARADAVKFFMVTLLEFDASRIKAIGLGEADPIAPNDTQEGRDKNGRVEITIKTTAYE